MKKLIAVVLATLSSLAVAGVSSGGEYGHETTTTKHETTTTHKETTTTLPQCPEEPCGTNPNTAPTTESSTTTTVVGTTAPTTSSTTTSTTSTSVAPTSTVSLVQPTTTSTTTTSILPTTTTTTSSLPPLTSSTTTSTTLPAIFSFGAAASVCVREVPFIRINFQNLFPQLAGQVGTLTMSDVNGNVVSTQSLTYQPGTVVDILYPGTSVNPDGSIDDVPGWILTDDGFWIRDTSDEFLREGINMTYTVNPTATAFVTYPPESSACANPDGPFQPAPIAGILPATQ